MGDPDKVALRAALEASGWDVECVERHEWWVYEAWRLRSTWRPQDAPAYITFLVVPDIDTGRATRIDDVWAVAVTRDAPSERMEEGRTDIRVSPNWPARLRDVVLAAAALRPAP